MNLDRWVESNVNCEEIFSVIILYSFGMCIAVNVISWGTCNVQMDIDFFHKLIL